ncbi:MAG: 2-amino-4-hydroxy-6-hydroxymethyldihydropteridine diphosphokinase [Acidobacteriota bacterium]
MIELPEDALVIGLGGNVGGEPVVRERFVRARDALAQLGDVKSAPLYRSAPIGPVQPAFLNTAIRVRYEAGTPGELIATVLEIERLLGRQRAREARNGPRPIDLDILLWGTRELRTPELEVPHPRLVERRFALQPIVDLFGDELRLAGSTAGALLRRTSGQAVELVAATW